MSTSLKKAFSLIIAFFITLWIAIAYTLTLAFTHFEPVVDPNYSIKKKTLHPVAVDAAKSRWSLGSSLFDQDALRRGELTLPIVLASRVGRTPEQLRLEVRLERPATRKGGSMRVLTLDDARRDESGRYHFEVTLPVPAPGYWEAELRAKLGESEEIFARHRWFVQ